MKRFLFCIVFGYLMIKSLHKKCIKWHLHITLARPDFRIVLRRSPVRHLQEWRFPGIQATWFRKKTCYSIWPNVKYCVQSTAGLFKDLASFLMVKAQSFRTGASNWSFPTTCCFCDCWWIEWFFRVSGQCSRCSCWYLSCEPQVSKATDLPSEPS